MGQIFQCPICYRMFELDEMGNPVCNKCEVEGWWVDPAGGIHYPDEKDPAAQYE